MRVLSLFDGMSCGQIALKEIGITPEVYYASEIDKFAIKQTQLNFPNTIQVGDVRDLNVEDLGRIDLILAGSPCTDMSFSGKRKGLSTVEGIEVKSLNEYLELKKQGFEFAGQSYLFWEFIRILNDVRKTNPDVLFLLENVKMGKKWEPVFDDAIGCKGDHINSALVSAQVRKRIYWTNIQDGIIPQPEDEGLTISDIAEYEVDEKYYLSEKVLNNLAFHLKRNHDKGNCYGANIKTKDEKSNTVTVKGKYMYDLICVAMRDRNPEKPTCRESGLKTVQMIEFKNDGKSNCLTTVQKNNLIFQIPRGFNQATCYVVEVVYERKETDLGLNKDNFLSIDLGLNNLCSCISNVVNSFIINGRVMKSVNQWYNKKKAKLMSFVGNKGTSNRIRKITLFRNCWIEDKLHKISRYIVDFCKSNNIGTIIIGLNKEWKNEINIGKRNNQHFVSIPHSKLIDKIVYKANLLGIEVITHEESYTSKIDHLAFEPLKKQESYLGRRKKRGLFQSSIGELINADINGAIGIARKVIGDSFIGKIIDSGFVFNPVRINIL